MALQEKVVPPPRIMPVGFCDALEREPSYETDVFIAGCGPISATYAKILTDAGYRVIVAELGAASSFSKISDDVWVPGAHKKNEVEYQKDIDRFVNVIQAALSPVSVSVEAYPNDTIDPISWGAGGSAPTVTHGKNPNQKANVNLAAQAVTRCVGGMATHWTCATPRFHKDVELPLLLSDKKASVAEWDRLYGIAEELIGTSTTEFDRSIRHKLVLETLTDAYKERQRKFEPLPLACERMPNEEYVYWHAADTILQHIYADHVKRPLFKLLANTRCTRLVPVNKHGDRKRIDYVELKNFLADVDNKEPTSIVKAKVFIIAAGAVSTPQILFKSGFFEKDDPLIPNLGKFITEQPMTFCQVVLKKELIEKIPSNPYNLDWWATKVEKHKNEHPEDPLKLPFRDLEPQVTARVTPEHPWHTQIHRDAFSYGAVPSTIDSRTIVDLRFFGTVDPCESNTITFETEYEDGYGMPQPTFNFQMSDADSERAHRMIVDMCEIASELGGFLPGSRPKFMTPGLPLHLGGTVRAGLDRKTHVADTNCKVYGFDNLYVGGNGVIPTGFATNPTLTSMGYAIRSAESIIRVLGGWDGVNKKSEA